MFIVSIMSKHQVYNRPCGAVLLNSPQKAGKLPWDGKAMRRKIQLTILLGRLSDPDESAGRVSMENPHDVMAEVKNIISLMFRHFEFTEVQQVFRDTLKIFSGKYPGYRQCNTLYHDLSHTMDCLLVTAKLIHGAFLNGILFDQRDVSLGLISAFMHDTGYIQAAEDDTGTGAKYTLCHISRSIEFMKKYFHDKGFPSEYLPICSNFLRCTGLDIRIGEIKFQSREHEILGKILGAADLIGQMANDNYLKKLPFLYYEFKEGKVPGFNDELELLETTPAFWEVVKKRFMLELGQVDRYSRDHFRVYLGIDQDLYRKAIDRNIGRLKNLLKNLEPNYPRRRPSRYPLGVILT
jgi:hypothetical protein